jgi:hypothetical protein
VIDFIPPLESTGFCPFAMVSGLPCPTCGGTRAVLALLRGAPGEALLHNAPVALATVFLALALVIKARAIASCPSVATALRNVPARLDQQLGRHPLAYFIGALTFCTWNIGRW